MLGDEMIDEASRKMALVISAKAAPLAERSDVDRSGRGQLTCPSAAPTT